MLSLLVALCPVPPASPRRSHALHTEEARQLPPKGGGKKSQLSLNKVQCMQMVLEALFIALFIFPKTPTLQINEKQSINLDWLYNKGV